MPTDKLVEFIKKWTAVFSLLIGIGGGIVALKGNETLADLLTFLAVLSFELWLLDVLRQPEPAPGPFGKLPPKMPTYTVEHRKWARTGIAAMLLLSLGVAAWSASSVYRQNTVNAFSAKYPFEDTGIAVRPEERLSISVIDPEATWNCGRTDSVTAEGYPGEGYADLVYGQANPCALIGSVSTTSPEIYFPVGLHTAILEKAGDLYLGCNDSEGRFGDNPTDSKLAVKVTVLRPRYILPLVLALINMGLIILTPKFRQRMFPFNA